MTFRRRPIPWMEDHENAPRQDRSGRAGRRGRSDPRRHPGRRRGDGLSDRDVLRPRGGPLLEEGRPPRLPAEGQGRGKAPAPDRRRYGYDREDRRGASSRVLPACGRVLARSADPRPQGRRFVPSGPGRPRPHRRGPDPSGRVAPRARRRDRPSGHGDERQRFGGEGDLGPGRGPPPLRREGGRHRGRRADARRASFDDRGPQRRSPRVLREGAVPTDALAAFL